MQHAIRYWGPDLAFRRAEMGASTQCVKIVECMPARPIGSEHAASATVEHIAGRETLAHGLRHGKHFECNRLCQAPPGKLEPPTLRLIASRPSQLSYGSHVGISTDANARARMYYNIDLPCKDDRIIAVTSRSLI